MKTKLSFVISLLSLGIAAQASAQDLSVKGNANFYVLHSQNTSTVQQDRVAVTGISTPAPYYGIGGKFEGGYQGVVGNATLTGSGARYGGSFQAFGGGSNYGIYSYASGGTAWAGFFSGNVYVSGTVTQASDAKLKMNIQALPDGTLDLILKLKPKSYRFRQGAMSKLSLPDGDQIGLLAQDVATVVPGIVKEISVPSDDRNKAEEKVLSVDYLKLIPLLIKAVQEQQTQINALKAQIAALSS
jgi:hypothetical protein